MGLISKVQLPENIPQDVSIGNFLEQRTREGQLTAPATPNLTAPVQTTVMPKPTAVGTKPLDVLPAPTETSTKPIDRPAGETPPIIGTGDPTSLPTVSDAQPTPTGYTTEPAIEMPKPMDTAFDRARAEATATGGPITTTGGQTYEGRTGTELLDESKQGLMDMLASDDPYMTQARLRGQRLAEARGLGGSSYAGRAAEGAAIEASMPLVQQAMALGSQERMTAQSNTASAAVAAADRSARAMLQDQQLAVQSGDMAKARQLEADIQRDKNELANYMQARDLAVQSGDRAEVRRLDDIMNRRILANQRQTQDKDIDFRAQENDLDRKLQEALQQTDIGYKKWLEQATFEHQELLQTSQQAVNMYGAFTEQAMHILNNPETTSAQKKAALAALREGLDASMRLLEGISGVDLEQYSPLNSTQQLPTTPGGPSWPGGRFPFSGAPIDDAIPYEAKGI